VCAHCHKGQSPESGWRACVQNVLKDKCVLRSDWCLKNFKERVHQAEQSLNSILRTRALAAAAEEADERK
jgi:hypothetical protein